MKKLFDDLVYQPEDIIAFTDGIPGIESSNRFILVRNEDYAPFEWLVSVEESSLRFAMLNPLLVYPEYKLNVHHDHLSCLKTQNLEDLLLYVFVTVAEIPQESTMNLMGPILINISERIGKQIILDNSQYGTKEPLIRT